MSDTTLYSRVSAFPVICGVELAYTADVFPSVIEGWQPFVNAMHQGDFLKAYFGKASVSFGEKSETPAGGTLYRQKLTIQFPATDGARAVRFQQIQKVRYIKVLLSTGKAFLMGRNDYEQNARPVIQIEASEHLAQVSFETVSITPCGFTPVPGGLPTLVPIDLTTEND